MASSFGLTNLNPRTLIIAIGLFIITIFFSSICLILIFSYQEKNRILNYEFQTILRGNGALLQNGDIRGFVEKIPNEADGFYFKSYNNLTSQPFIYGTESPYNFYQCSLDNYLQYDLTFCRPYQIPWRIILLLLSGFIIIFSFILISILKFNNLVVQEFKELFKIASIPYSGELSFTKSWSIAQKMATLFKDFQKASIENERNRTAGEVAKQVAHDIRSPLSALTLMTNQLDQIPEDKRIIIRSAVSRINDIANELLTKSKESQIESTSNDMKSNNNLSIQLLSPLIDSIISEKRVQYRDKQGIEIEAEINLAYGLFSKINGIEMKRIISNLVNNAVEAFSKEVGKVTVAVKQCDEKIGIIIQDNGKGMPESILKKLGEKGLSFGKEGTQSGSGLGVYHAKKTVEESGGQFEIISSEGVGTTITMTFEKVVSPKWFVEKLILNPGMTVVSLDDDISIHQIWKGCFDTINILEFGIEHKTFTSGNIFKKWFTSLPPESERGIKDNTVRLYLLDFELLNQNFTGLDIIEELQIGSQAILVTSRYEEDKIRERCERLGVRLIPKAMAGFVPIEISKQNDYFDGALQIDDSMINRSKITKDILHPIKENKIRYDICLIDDDQTLVQALWKMVAMTKGHNIKIFSTPEEFQSSADLIDRATPIFIDVSLGSGVSGVDFSEVVHKMGFLNINLATGYSADSIKAPSFVRRIIGKDYPEDI